MRRNFIIALLFLATSFQFVGAQSLYETISQFQADQYALMRKYTVTESAEYYGRFSKFYSDWTATLTKIPFDKLSQQDKVDYVLLKNQIGKELYFLKIKQWERDIYL